MAMQCTKVLTGLGKPELIFGSKCESKDFPSRANEFIEHYGMKIEEKISGLDEIIWTVSLGEAKFCISWDIWMRDVSISGVEETTDSDVLALMPN